MTKAKKIRREIEIGGVKRWISGNTEQEYAENLIQALRGETDNQAQFIPPAPEGWRSTKTQDGAPISAKPTPKPQKNQPFLTGFWS